LAGVYSPELVTPAQRYYGLLTRVNRHIIEDWTPSEEM
jgi:hypothetical protein